MDWKGMVWGQFGAAIDMLENAVSVCPEDLWSGPAREQDGGLSGTETYWYVAVHALYFLDVYLDESEEGFVPPAPFIREGERASPTAPMGRYSRALVDWARLDGLRLPERPYTKEQVLDYLAHGRDKCRTTIATMSDEVAAAPCGFPWLRLSHGELLLYNMRHVQHHAAQLNLLLRQGVNSAPHWVGRATTPLADG
jgi:hypothetical protein